MKSFLDFEEKNVEKAVQKACDELNVSRDKLKYDIISHGSSGIFGLVGTKKALIRVFVPDLSSKQLQSEIFDGAPAPALKDGTKQDLGQPVSNDVSALVDEAFGQVTNPIPEKIPEPAPKKPRPVAAKHTPRPSRPAPAKTKIPPEKQEKTKPKRESPKTEKTGLDQQPAVTMPDFQKNEAEPSEPLPSASVEPILPVDPIAQAKNAEAAAALALSMSQKILDALAVDAELSVDNTSDFYRINVKVSEPGVLIGKKGQTLDAIQYLIDKVVNKQCGKGNHIVFDVEGYVESRKIELTDLASRLASKAMKTGKPSTMTRMNAHDRRIVHVSLKSNPSVRTQSVGDGYYRKLIIFPKKKTSKQLSPSKQSCKDADAQTE